MLTPKRDNISLEKWKAMGRKRGEKRSSRDSDEHLVLFAELVITELFAIWPHVFLKHTVKVHLLKCFQVVLLKKRP